MTGTDQRQENSEVDGTPIGRRTILGLITLAGAGVLGGKAIQDGLAKVLAPIELRDPTGLISLIPVGDSFRFYSVTGAVPTKSAQSYRLAIDGMVTHTASYTLADLQAMPQTRLVRDFQCITGWHVSQVPWSGVRLSTLLDRAVPALARPRFDSVLSTAHTPKVSLWNRPDAMTS